MAVGDIYTAVAHSTYQGSPNVFAVFASVVTELDLLALPGELALFMELSWIGQLRPLAVPGVSFNCTTARQVWPNTSIEHVRPIAPPLLGTRLATVSAPGQISCVIQQVGNVDAPTARNRGRDFHFGMDCADILASGLAFTQAFQDALLAAYVTVTFDQTFASGNAVQLGIFSRTQALENIDPQFVSNGGTVPDPPTFGDAFFNTLLQVRSNPLIRTQRRRQPEDPCRVYTSANVPS